MSLSHTTTMPIFGHARQYTLFARPESRVETQPRIHLLFSPQNGRLMHWRIDYSMPCRRHLMTDRIDKLDADIADRIARATFDCVCNAAMSSAWAQQNMDELKAERKRFQRLYLRAKTATQVAEFADAHAV